MMRNVSRKCIIIRKIVEYLGNDVAAKLPKIHAVTGCDKAPFFYMVLGKLEFVKSVSMEKKSSDFSTQLMFHVKFQKQQLEIWKSFSNCLLL